MIYCSSTTIAIKRIQSLLPEMHQSLLETSGLTTKSSASFSNGDPWFGYRLKNKLISCETTGVKKFLWQKKIKHHLTLSGHTGNALARHPDGRAFASHWMQEVLRFVAAFIPYNRWSTGSIAMCRVGGNGQSIGSTVSDAIIRSWMWSTAIGSSPLGYCSIALLQALIIYHTLCGSRFSIWVSRKLKILLYFYFDRSHWHYHHNNVEHVQ